MTDMTSDEPTPAANEFTQTLMLRMSEHARSQPEGVIDWGYATLLDKPDMTAWELLDAYQMYCRAYRRTLKASSDLS